MQLSLTEQTELQQYEATIERGLKTFVDVGNALLAIRDGRLYRQEYGTFEEYCRERWGMTRQNANRLIAASETVLVLEPIGSKPENESQIRPLTSLKPEQQREVWQRAVESAPNGKVTAAHVEATKREYLAPLWSADGESADPEPYEDDEWTPPASNGRYMDVHYSSEKGEWETPQDLFDLLDVEFGFNLDVCALVTNTKCEQFFSPEDDGLSQDWGTAVCWMNPPYGDGIKNWMAKAWEASMQGATVVCLIPARTDTGWWWDYCIRGEIRFLRGRLKFGNAENSAPFPSAVVVFRGGSPDVIWWEWK